ncbi:hypothetical protein GQ53DRAFT_755990 [Thozetella sp. PMI_491]|nr:hypothetical protein GQ53DRAFT_755990 [Thozetella sp. PMI_491]
MGFPSVPGVGAAAALAGSKPVPGRLNAPFLKNHSPRAHISGFSGVGISSGMKASDINPGGYLVQTIKPRVTQRNLSDPPTVDRYSGMGQQDSIPDATNQSF